MNFVRRSPWDICVLRRTKWDRTFQTFVFLWSEQWNQEWNPFSPTPEDAVRKLTETLLKIVSLGFFSPEEKHKEFSIGRS